MSDYVVPCILLLSSLLALRRKENTYDLLVSGAADGLKLVFSIIPALVMLLTAVSMLRASGAMEHISNFLAPAFRFVGIPPETAMLVLIRPFSGSGDGIACFLDTGGAKVDADGIKRGFR